MPTEKHNTLQLSIVVPAYNEAESLPILLEQIQSVLKTHAYRAEVIFINDGSTDATAEVLDALSDRQTHQCLVRLIHFKHNRGKAEALMAASPSQQETSSLRWMPTSKTTPARSRSC